MIFRFAKICLLAVLPAVGGTQQPAGGDSVPPIPRPAYTPGNGPVVAIDEAHKNTHSYNNQQGMVRLLQRDGYRVRPFAQAISEASLEGVDVLVIADPGGWEGDASLGDAEVHALVTWVRQGGSLLLIIDHMPFPLHGASLTAALGITSWHNGFAMVETTDSLPAGRIIFQRPDQPREAGDDVVRIGPPGTPGFATYRGVDAVLRPHPISNGRAPDENVRAVMTFVGSAFQPPDGAQALLVLPKRSASLMPDSITADVRRGNPPRTPVGSWLQGAVVPLGKGRVALFGEVGLFSGQWPVHPAASENYKLILNVMHWLTHAL